ncbi:unnamed protein product [Camellia sinensis]
MGAMKANSHPADRSTCIHSTHAPRPLSLLYFFEKEIKSVERKIKKKKKRGASLLAYPKKEIKLRWLYTAGGKERKLDSGALGSERSRRASEPNLSTVRFSRNPTFSNNTKLSSTPFRSSVMASQVRTLFGSYSKRVGPRTRRIRVPVHAREARDARLPGQCGSSRVRFGVRG